MKSGEAARVGSMGRSHGGSMRRVREATKVVLMVAGLAGVALAPASALAEGAAVGAANEGEKARAQDLYKLSLIHI